MATCANPGTSSSHRSHSSDEAPSPDEVANLMNNTTQTSRYQIQKWVFTASNPYGVGYASGRFHSPRIVRKNSYRPSPTPPPLVRSLSEDIVITSHRSSTQIYHTPEGLSKSTSRNLSDSSPASIESPLIRGHRRSQSSNDSPYTPVTRIHRSPSFTSQVGSVEHGHRTSVFSETRIPGISRTSTRRSFGREWTRSHWEKVRDLELESERARRCSKLSSGFAPLMVFGGLVFICIGVSAATNNGADKERLKSLSAAPMAMGIFMLILGLFLIGTWFGCRGRAKGLEQRLLHGSRRSSIDESVVQNLLSKISATVGGNTRQQTSSPSLPGVTLDGVDVLKPQSDNEVRRETRSRSPGCLNETNGCCNHCGAATPPTQVIIETSI